MNQIDLSTFWNSLGKVSSFARAVSRLANPRVLIDTTIKDPVAKAIITGCCMAPALRRGFARLGVTPARFGERPVRIPFSSHPEDVALIGAGTNHLTFQLFWRGINYYEPFTRMVIEALTRSRDIFIDVGANAGFFSLVAAKLNPGLQAIAFEPNPKMFALLSQNKELNPLSNLIAEPLALSNVETEATLFFNRSDMSASLVPDFQNCFNPTTGSVTVKTTTLDAYVERNGLEGSMVLKVDVEGHEREVLQGAERTISTRRPDIVMEVLENFDPAIMAKFKEHGYRFYKITNRGLLVANTVGLTRIGDFTFFNCLLTTRPIGELYGISEQIQKVARGINLYETSKYVTHPV